MEGEAAALNVVSEESGFEELGEAALKEGVGFGVFVAEVDEAAGCSGGKASDDHAFNEGIRIVVHEGAVLKATGFTFIGVADDGFRVTVALGDRVPFDSGGEARSATSGELGGGDRFDDALGSGVAESFGEGGKAAVGLVSLEGVVSLLADVGKKALFVFAGIGSGNRGRSRFEIVGRGASEGGVSGEDGDGFVTAAGAGHFGGGLSLGFQGFENFVSAAHAANISGADAGGFKAAGGAGKVMVEGDRAVEIGKRGFQSIGNGAESVVGKVAVAIMKSVEKREERSGLIFPLLDQFFVSRICHVQELRIGGTGARCEITFWVLFRRERKRLFRRRRWDR